MIRAFALILLLSACSGPLGTAASLLTGGGPNVAANVQAGKTNTQSVGTNQVDNRKIVVEEGATPNVSQDSVTNQELPPWVWVVGLLLFIVGWVTDTPSTYAGRLLNKKEPR